MLNYPVVSHSWTLVSPTMAIKSADPSLLKEKKTGVPKDIVHFFPEHDVAEGERVQINCKVGSSLHKLQLERSSGRRRLAHIPIPENFSLTGSLMFSIENGHLQLAFGDALDIADLEVEESSTTCIRTNTVRIKQSEFRQNVLTVCGSKCCVTGVTDTSILIASHIKSWASSNDQERVDGHNGLLLAPHVDKLFDKHLISFNDDGSLLVSKRIERRVLDCWGIQSLFISQLTPRQCVYLAWHREQLRNKDAQFVTL
ncbi:HNH endonuclease [Vibrio alginolyticus]|nr:HNH endonuclease [Vibrio alginolyticus]